MLINHVKITLENLKKPVSCLEQKGGKKVSYSIVLLKSSNATSIKSNVTWIKTMRCINHFLLFHRRQNGRAYIKRHILGMAEGWSTLCQSFKTNGT